MKPGNSPLNLAIQEVRDSLANDEKLRFDKLERPLQPQRPGHRLRRMLRPDHLLAILALLVLTSCSLIEKEAIARLGSTDAAQETRQLYMRSGSALLPIDNLTLEDRPDGSYFQLDLPSELDDEWLIVSDLGTRIATSVRDDPSIEVADVAGAPEGRRFDFPGDAYPWQFSHDAGKLLVQVLTSEGTRPVEWYVLDIQSGKVNFIDARGWWVHLDPSGKRFYAWLPAQLGLSTGPSHPILSAYSVDTGKVAQQLELPEVRAGEWHVGTDRGDVPITELLEPGFAVSPDGQFISVVHADQESLTLIDARRMRILSTRPLTRQLSLLDQIIRPRVAFAKQAEITQWSTVYSPDGNWLYAFGQIDEFDEQGNLTTRGTGLRLIHIESAAIVAESFDGDLVSWVTTVPEAETIYAYIQDPRSGSRALHRLDASSLASLAARAANIQDAFLLAVATP